MTSQEIVVVREALDITQSQLAQLVGVHTLTVSKWERGHLSPSPHQIALLAAFQQAANADKEAGHTAVKIMMTSGVAAALHHLLDTSLESR